VKPLATALLLLSMCCPCLGSEVLYNNGPDTGSIGAWPINFGRSVSNSFTLEQDSRITDVVFSIWSVDDLNHPLRAKWKITTEPFGGEVLASGESLLGLESYFHNRLYTVWKMKIQGMNANLPAGTYYLEIYDVLMQFQTWAFWGESDGIGCTSRGCPSTAYFDPARSSGYGMTQPIGSESFEIIGTPSSE
jgi:hypothetical protein